MWPTIIITVIVVGVALLGMAIGAIMRGRSIQGSCGGMANMRDEQGRTICDACTNPAPECRGERAEQEPLREETPV